MLTNYKTVSLPITQDITVKKSLFIAHITPVQTEEEANAFLAEIRKKYWDATHNTYAYIIGANEEVQKASDDGEPQGTAGKPILNVLKHHQLKNVLLVVTRYFGGILLGAGGLVRAYSDAAKNVILHSQIVEYIEMEKMALTCDYYWYGKIENLLKSENLPIIDLSFQEKVTIILCLPIGEFNLWQEKINNLTNGEVTYTHFTNCYYQKIVK